MRAVAPPASPQAPAEAAWRRSHAGPGTLTLSRINLACHSPSSPTVTASIHAGEPRTEDERLGEDHELGALVRCQVDEVERGGMVQ